MANHAAAPATINPNLAPRIESGAARLEMMDKDPLTTDAYVSLGILANIIGVDAADNRVDLIDLKNKDEVLDKDNGVDLFAVDLLDEARIANSNMLSSPGAEKKVEDWLNDQLTNPDSNASKAKLTNMQKAALITLVGQSLPNTKAGMNDKSFKKARRLLEEHVDAFSDGQRGRIQDGMPNLAIGARVGTFLMSAQMKTGTFAERWSKNTRGATQPETRRGRLAIGTVIGGLMLAKAGVSLYMNMRHGVSIDSGNGAGSLDTLHTTTGPATHSPSVEAIASATGSSTPDVSASPTGSPSASGSPEVTPSGSASPTGSPTSHTEVRYAGSGHLETVTVPGPEVTTSSSPEASVTPTVSPTGSASPSPSETASPTGSPSASASHEATPSGSASPTGSPSASGSPEVTPSASPSGSVSPSPAETTPGAGTDTPAPEQTPAQPEQPAGPVKPEIVHDGETYRIHKGDNLTKIAESELKKAGVEINDKNRESVIKALVKDNDIANRNVILAGDRLDMDGARNLIDQLGGHTEPPKQPSAETLAKAHEQLNTLIGPDATPASHDKAVAHIAQVIDETKVRSGAGGYEYTGKILDELGIEDKQLRLDITRELWDQLSTDEGLAGVRDSLLNSSGDNRAFAYMHGDELRISRPGDVTTLQSQQLAEAFYRTAMRHQKELLGIAIEDLELAA